MRLPKQVSMRDKITWEVAMPPTTREISDEQIAAEFIEELEEHRAYEAYLARRLYEELCEEERRGHDGPEWIAVTV